MIPNSNVVKRIEKDKAEFFLHHCVDDGEILDLISKNLVYLWSAIVASVASSRVSAQ